MYYPVVMATTHASNRHDWQASPLFISMVEFVTPKVAVLQCSWTCWRSSDGLVRDGGLTRRYEDSIVTIAELIGLFDPKVLALPARALRSTSRLRALAARRLRAVQKSCFSPAACSVCRS